MYSSGSSSRKKSGDDVKRLRGSNEGKKYEKLALVLLAKRGYELSASNTEFSDFAISREVRIGKDGKFDDVVFRYEHNVKNLTNESITKDNDNKKVMDYFSGSNFSEDQQNRRNLIFVQIKHKQDDCQIDSEILSADPSTSKVDGMSRDFNLKKYFISYLSVRAELEITKSEEFKNGKIKYVVLFTNAGLNIDELNEKGFDLRKAPGDVIKLFALKKRSLNTQESSDCYQLGRVSEDLHKLFKKSSDVYRLGRALAPYVIWKNYKEQNILGIDKTPVKHYHVVLAKEVIKKSVEVKILSFEKQDTSDKKYCEAQFKEDFINNDETGFKQKFLNALLETIRELDESKKNLKDEELKEILKEIKFKVVPYFGETKGNKRICEPCKLVEIRDDDITDFLKCLVFVVNQPRVLELEVIFKSSLHDMVVAGTSLRQVQDKLESTSLEVRENIEKELVLDRKRKFEDKWISREKIVHFIEEQMQIVSKWFSVAAMTLTYENEIKQYGKFNADEKFDETLEIFLTNNRKLICIETPSTLLSSVKILQYLDTKEEYKSDCRISVKLDILNCKENRDSVLKAFKSEKITLITIECRHVIMERDVAEFLWTISDTVRRIPNKKAIFIIQGTDIFLAEKVKANVWNTNLYVQVKDSIHIKLFIPKEDPLLKEVLIFQGQKEKVNLSKLTGIGNWTSYVERFDTKCDMIDTETLIKLLNNEEIEVGSEPLGISHLDGAFSTLYEEINLETLANKLTSHVLDNDDQCIYIISGICGAELGEKIDKLTEYLSITSKREMIGRHLGDINIKSKIQIADDPFNEADFKKICYDHPKKKIFWISVKSDVNGSKAVFQQSYNPNFYIKRRFKNIIIRKDIKRQLTNQNRSQIFIFYCVRSKEELCKTLAFKTKYEEKLFEENYKNGKIKVFALKSEAETVFQKLSKQYRIVHLLKFEKKQFIWCNTHGKLATLRKVIDHDPDGSLLIEEDKLKKEIRDRKTVIIADEPGMGKSTTMTKLYESQNLSECCVASHWIIRLNLRDHMQTITDAEFKEGCINIVNVVDFLSKTDLKLKHNLAKILLEMALDKNKMFAKPILLAFDGYDEILDENHRKKIILLFKFLKNETCAKLWVTTRVHYQNTLENELTTFAFTFDPMSDEMKEGFIKNYLQDRFWLILSEKRFTELFSVDDNGHKNKNIHIYIEMISDKLKKLFKDNKLTFIGTPLQLYLTLESSKRHFKKWIETDNVEGPNFDCFGNDILELYENFIEMKHDTYFKKMCVNENAQKAYIKLFNDIHEDFALSVISKSKPKYDFEEFRDIVLSAGIIKYNDGIIEFFHTTFRDYFASKLFISWIREVPNKLLNLWKHEYLLKVILKEPDFQLIRTFINFKLKNLSEIEPGRKILKHYASVAEKVFETEEKSMTDERGTALHVALEESNRHIALFLLNCLKGHKALKGYLFTLDKNERTVLHVAFEKENYEIIQILLDSVAEIPTDKHGNILSVLSEFLLITTEWKWTALHISCVRGLYEAARLVLGAAALILLQNLNIYNHILFITDKWKRTALHIACELEHTKIVKLLVDAAVRISKDTNYHTFVLNEFLFITDEFQHTALHLACTVEDYEIVSLLLDAAAEISEYAFKGKHKYAFVEGRYDALRKFLLALDGSKRTALHLACERENFEAVRLLLDAAARICQCALEEFLYCLNGDLKNALDIAVSRNNIQILKQLLNRAKDKLEFVLKEDAMQMIFSKLYHRSVRILQSHLSCSFCEACYHEKKECVECLLQVFRQDKNSMRKLLLHRCGRRNALTFASKSSCCTEMLLSAAKSTNDSEVLIQLLLPEESTLPLENAITGGNLYVTEKILSVARYIDDDNETLMQLLLDEKNKISALHFAVENGDRAVTNLLLKTAVYVGINFLNKFIFAVDSEGLTAVDKMADDGDIFYFTDLFKILEGDEFQDIQRKVIDIFDTMRLTRMVYFEKYKLHDAVRRNDIDTVKIILNRAKNSTDNPKEKLRILLSPGNGILDGNIFKIAYSSGNPDLMKELLSHFESVKDEEGSLSAILKEFNQVQQAKLLRSKRCCVL